MKVEMRSALVGAALGAGIAPSLQLGRFQVAANEGHAFVLDTATGQTWEKFEPTSAGESSPDFEAPKLRPQRDQ